MRERDGSRPLRVPFALPPGRVLELEAPRGRGAAPYEVVRPLALGGNSQSYLARAEDGRFAVLKAARWIEESDFDADLRVEEAVLRRVTRNKHLVALLASGRDPDSGKLVLAYERVFPNPLLLLSKPAVRACFPNDPGTRYYPLPPLIALALLRDLFAGLAHLLEQGFVHHDVKLANLMIRIDAREDRVPDHEVLGRALQGRAEGVLIDVGGSRGLGYLEEFNRGGSDSDVSVVPPQLTPFYAPPEALLATENDTGLKRRLLLPSLDVYAAGFVGYALTSGRGAYDHVVSKLPTSFDGFAALKEREREGQLRPLSYEAIKGRPEYQRVAGDVYEFLSACADVDPSRRPAPAEGREFLAGLVRFLRRRAAERAGRPRADSFFGTDAAQRRSARDRSQDDRRSAAGARPAPSRSRRTRPTGRAPRPRRARPGPRRPGP